MIAYGLHIDARVEMSTLGETNNAQFFSEPEKTDETKNRAKTLSRNLELKIRSGLSCIETTRAKKLSCGARTFAETVSGSCGWSPPE